MSVVIDFYKGNGSKTKLITFKKYNNGWWYFKFFRLTVIKSEMDIVSEYSKCINILSKAEYEELEEGEMKTNKKIILFF